MKGAVVGAVCCEGAGCVGVLSLPVILWTEVTG
jgi:hypothetical protein